MKIRSRCVFALSMCILLMMCASSCSEEVSESEHCLCTGYWQDTASPDRPLMKFDEDGNIFYYVYRYMPMEDIYHAYHDLAADGKYKMDAQNSTFLFLPNGWYNIYLLTPSAFNLATPAGKLTKMKKVPDRKVKLVSKEEF